MNHRPVALVAGQRLRAERPGGAGAPPRRLFGWDDDDDDSGVPENWSWVWEALK